MDSGAFCFFATNTIQDCGQSAFCKGINVPLSILANGGKPYGRRFAMIPTNEQGTIVLFSKLAEELGYTFKEIGTRCPDAILEKDGKPVRVEFEFASRSFLSHKHDPNDVDLVICWEDNWPSCPVPVLSLESYVTLAHKTEEVTPAWWQRIFLWWGALKASMAQSKLGCPACGARVNLWCTDMEWDDECHEYYQWINRKCPECNWQNTKCVPSE